MCYLSEPTKKLDTSSSVSGMQNVAQSDGGVAWFSHGCIVVCLVNRECAGGYAKCQGVGATRSCVRITWLCDGDNDCGNNWDENPAQCGQSC